MHHSPLPFSAQLIEQIAADHPTPFYVYHEDGMRQRVRELYDAFAWNEGFKQFFAVKATPNPHIVAILAEEGCGADCSSPAELVLCEHIGLCGEGVMFTSNNTTSDEFSKAAEVGAIINLDSPSLLDKLQELPSLPPIVSYRYNPGSERRGNVIIGEPQESKFGCTRQQILEGYRRSREIGIGRFGLHAMVVSNELLVSSLLDTAQMLFEMAVEIQEHSGASVEFINLGGGIGVPYRVGEKDVDLQEFGAGVQSLYESLLVPAGLGKVQVMMENGRAITGPFGYLVTRVTTTKKSHKHYVGVDACMSNLMRPGMYGAYHHLSVLGKEDELSVSPVDVVGSLCENNDKFAIDRPLPEVQEADIVVVHDAGAHGHSMGFQYNGRLRSAEFLFNNAGEVRKIRRAETLDDYFATVDFPQPKKTGQSAAS
ncbi:MAG: diaminopimelate decarboxylase [Pirellulales bacterium]|nr:diaminopimelate decarboxylase [Pirellulales bacterium]